MRRIPAGAILSIVLAAASCGGEGSTEPDDDTLTGEEALALVEIAMGQGLVLAGNVTSGSEIVTPEGVMLQFTAPCAMGGTVAVDAQASFIGDPGDEGAESAGVGLSVTLVHSGCTERHEGTGIAFTLDGAPELEVSIELSFSAEFMVAISGTVDGTVRWATEDGRSGSCTMDVGIETVDDPDALLSLTVAGQACGVQIMESFSTSGLFLS